MDRFIDNPAFLIIQLYQILKSNMDRFIAETASPLLNSSESFKIQYG